MLIKKILIMIAAFAVVIACSKKEEKTADIPAPEAKTKVEAPAKAVKKEYALPGEFRSSKYTDNTKWLNGVNLLEKKRFFFTIDKTDPTPFMPGYTLAFAKTGDAVVVNVYRLDNPNNSSIFITVDKELDPAGDGYPNPIYVRSLKIQPGKYSQENAWRSGISLTQPREFFFNVKKNTHIPFKVGDRLKFASAGEALITGVSRSEKQENFSQIFVTVNKILAPEGDGYPNTVEMIF